MSETKKCVKCDKPKPLSAFNKSGNGLHSWCKPCHQRNWRERAHIFNGIRRAIEVGERLSRAAYAALDKTEKKRLREKYKEIGMDAKMGHCDKHGYTVFTPDDIRYGGKRDMCKQCKAEDAVLSNAQANPKNNAISKVMGQRMVELGILSKEHYYPEYDDLRLRLRNEIEADGSWKQYVRTEANQQADLSKKAPVLLWTPDRPSFVHKEVDGLGGRRSKKAPVQPGKSVAQKDFEDSLLYMLFLYPFPQPPGYGFENQGKIGITQEDPNVYIKTEYRHRLPGDHPGAQNLLFDVILEMVKDGYKTEQELREYMSLFGTPVPGRDESFIFDNKPYALKMFADYVLARGGVWLFNRAVWEASGGERLV